MSDHVITWTCAYTNITAQSLAALNTALVSDYGLVQIGTPTFSTFGTDGISAGARYQKGSVSILAEAGVVAITARIRKTEPPTPNWALIKNLFRDTLGLTKLPDGTSLGIVEQTLEN